MKLTTLASLILAATAEITGVLATGTQTLNTKVSRAEKTGQQLPSSFPVANQAKAQGCFSSSANMTTFAVPNMSSGSCTKYCISKGFWVAGLNGGSCYCGFVYPPLKDRAPDSKCHTPCPSYPPEACGTYPTDGDEDSYYSIFNTGINLLVKNYSPPKPSTSSSSHSSSQHSSTSTSTSTSTSSATSSATDATTTVTAPPDTTTVPSNPDGSNDDNDDNGNNNDNNNNKKSKSSPNVAAIVAGVVVGVVVVGAAIGGGFFFLRRKRNAEIEEEHRRNAAVNAFISGSKPPSSHGSISMTDSRMDPVLAHRRLSDGSIADNQDYSRKILRVTNA